jgi:hypothetical protein
MDPTVPIEIQSGQQTARKAAELLVSKSVDFIIPTAVQRQNLLVAFAKKGKVVYGKAFDIVKLSRPIDLSDLEAVEAGLKNITVLEIKSSRKKLGTGFAGYFFSLTAGEVLVAQSLKAQFRFAFVDTSTGEHLELTLSEVFAKAKGIYPTWSICF